MIRNGQKLLAIPVLALASLGMACSSSGGLLPQRTDHSQAVEELKRRVLELQRQAAVNEEEILRLRQRLDDLETRKATAKAPPPPQAPTRAPEPVEVFQPVVIEESDLEIPPRNEPSSEDNDITGSRPGSSAPSVAESAGQRQFEAPTGGAGSVGPEAQAVYDRGYTLYHQGRYQEAEASFVTFLRGHSDSDLADNAQYWVGESRYARKDFQGALQAFRETVERFPQGNKVPDAMLKAGQCFEALGDPDAARETYGEIVSRFSESAASVRAEERMERLQ